MDPAVESSQHAGEPAQDSISLRQLFIIFLRRWRLFSIVWASTVALTAVYSLTSTRLYRPQATLEIRPETPLITSDPNEAAALAGRTLWENYYRTQESILTSPTLLQAALRALPEAVRRSYETAVDPVKVLSRQVQIEKTRSSFIMAVGFIDRDPEKATQIVNTLVSLYQDDANKRLQETKSGAAELLSKEALPAIRGQVADADKALQKFLEDGQFIDPEEQYKALLESRRTITTRITQIRLKAIQVRSELDTLQGYAADGITGIFNPAFHSTKALELLWTQLETSEADLARTRKELKDDHPAVIEHKDQVRRVEEKIRSAIQGTLKSLGLDIIAVEREERAAFEEQRRVEQEMATSAKRAQQFKRLDADLTAAREVYNSYLKKHGETSATSGTRLASVRVVDHATVPLTPYKPNVPMNLSIGAILGLVMGVAGVLVSEHLDDRVRSPKEIEVFIKLPVLAVIPKLEKSSDEDKPFMLGDQSSLVEFEAFRVLRAELTTRLEGVQGPKMIAVVSALHSEGKSTVTVNLAKALAMEGRKVLIFDADMRRPSMQPSYGAPEAPGLERLLAGEVTVEQALAPSKLPGVDLLGMKKGTNHAGEIVSSARFEEVFSEVRKRYDYVIVDSTPVNQVAESALIARRADTIVMVVREKQTSRGAALAAARRLLGMGGRVAGAVLNCAHPGRGEYGYGYYGYYGYAYRSYGYGEGKKA